MNNVSRQSEHLRTILSIHYQYLNEIAEEMAKEEDLLSEANLDSLVTIHNKTDLERMALIEADGTAHYDTGDVKNVFHRSYFQEAFGGSQTLSDPIESSLDHEVRVVLGVPVCKENEVIGVLGGSYNVTALSRMMFDDLFNGEGYCLITDKDGKVVFSRIVPAGSEQRLRGGAPYNVWIGIAAGSEANYGGTPIEPLKYRVAGEKSASFVAGKN